jgi:hypothetical protein
MISSFTSGSFGSSHPWVVPHPKAVESYGAFMLLKIVDISSLVIPSPLVVSIHPIHPHMECDDPTLPDRVVESTSSHDFLDTEFPLDKDIPYIMASMFDPKDEMMQYRSSYPD